MTNLSMKRTSYNLNITSNISQFKCQQVRCASVLVILVGYHPMSELSCKNNFIYKRTFVFFLPQTQHSIKCMHSTVNTFINKCNLNKEALKYLRKLTCKFMLRCSVLCWDTADAQRCSGSGAQQGDTATRVSALPQALLPHRLLQNTESSSPSYAVGPPRRLLQNTECSPLSYAVGPPHRLLQNTECSSPSYAVGPCWVSILCIYSSVYIVIPNSQFIVLHPFPLW